MKNEKYYSEIKKLAIYFLDHGVPFSIHPCWDGYQICVPVADGENEFDVVCHSGSYGHEKGLLEVMGVVCEEVCDDVEGWLTAADVVERFLRHSKYA